MMGNFRDCHDSLLFTQMTNSTAEGWAPRVYLLSPLCVRPLAFILSVFCISYIVFLLRQLNLRPYADKLLLND